jgi:hypothetical protein
MFQLRLTAEEKALLVEVLEGHLADARMEIADTDSIEFKARLKARKEALNKILEALRKTEKRK